MDDGPVTVSAARPVEREVIDFADFTGRTEAELSLDVRARVTGYLVQSPFKEGSEVKEGDLLFEIDPRPYQAQLDQADAELKLREAEYKFSQAENRRVNETNKKLPGTFTAAEVEAKQANEDEALAAVNAAKAQVESARLNVEFTKVTTPINGQVNRFNVTIGNLINQDQTVLTTVVSQDPMYVYFDMDEPTMLRVVRRLMSAPADPLGNQKFPVKMGLADEEGFPHDGFVNFANNVVSSGTGTIALRGVFENPPGTSGRRLLRPGMFVRIRLPLGQPHSALLVTEKALATDQGQKYLLTVDDKDVVQYRKVTTGPLQDDGLRVIETGLKPGERVIVSGLQLARPGMKVTVENTDMAAGNAPSATPEKQTETGTKNDTAAPQAKE